MSNELDWAFGDPDDAKAEIRTAVRYLLKGVAGSDRSDIVQEIIANRERGGGRPAARRRRSAGRRHARRLRHRSPLDGAGRSLKDFREVLLPNRRNLRKSFGLCGLSGEGLRPGTEAPGIFRVAADIFPAPSQLQSWDWLGHPGRRGQAWRPTSPSACL
jgi:hypothetical protein